MASGIHHLAFVYGTLMRANRNSDIMSDTSNGIAVYLGKGQTAIKYPLVVATEYNVPFLLKVPGQGHEVHGEVYEVDEIKLQVLDKFEDHPELYKRDIISVHLTEDQNGKALSPPMDLQCSTYFLSEVKEDFLNLEWLKEFITMTEDKLPIRVRTQRKIPVKKLVFPDRY